MRTQLKEILMHQVIDGKSVYVVNFDAMPALPITGLTLGEEAYQKLFYQASYPHGPSGTLAGMFAKPRPTYAEALTDAIKTGVIAEPGKYGIHLVPGTNNYEIYKIVE
jgi:hypothetical protein